MRRTGVKKSVGIPLLEYAGRIINASLAEDIGTGDITTEAVVPKNLKGHGRIIAKEAFVLCGIVIAEKVFATTGEDIKFRSLADDGDVVVKGQVLAAVSGNLRGILEGERLALNFLQRLSGIATLTREFIKKTSGTHVKILDTRKTTPMMRILERYAVRTGGGVNHRFGLFDRVLIKDNHIKIAGGVKEAVGIVKRNYPKGIPIEIETKNTKEVKEALLSGVQTIMLDNMGLKEIKKAVGIIDGKTLVEVSGGVTLKNVGRIARTGADYISVGALTHSARAVDISFEVERWNRNSR
ncbi:MAG: carboxylating nicotinate-nucleotide diphosphorylase [Deltaproteobacteria bacterium]|nr:carboxylating nicotinate-nucleotide diphosphorylase [Deltaproteobacteria bacterium]